MGAFLALWSGINVFLWTGLLTVLNNNVLNAIYINFQNIEGTFTGTAVIHANQGKDVLITSGALSNERILSDINGRSSFAGWMFRKRPNYD